VSYIIKRNLIFCLIMLSGMELCAQTRDTALSNQYLSVGQKMYEAKDYYKAFDNCSISIKYDLKNWQAYLCKANSERLLDKYSQAIADYSKVIELEPYLKHPYIGRGDVYLEINSYILAIKDYNVAILLDSNELAPYYGRGNCYSKQKKYSLALLDYNKAIDLSPQYTNTYYKRGIAYFNLNNYEKSIKDFDSYIFLGGRGNTVTLAKGLAYLFSNEKKSNIDSSIVLINDFLRVDSVTRYDAYTYLGMAYTSQLDSINARKAFKKAIESSDTSVYSESYFQLGLLEYKLKHYTTALKYYELSKEISMKTKNASYYVELSKCYLHLNDTAQALIVITSALLQDSLNVDLHLLRIDCLSSQLTINYNQIMSDCDFLLTFSPKRTVLGRVYYILYSLKVINNDKKGAMEALNKSIKLNPEDPFLYTFRAAVLLSQKKNKEARIDIDNALSLNSKFWQTYYLKAIIESRRYGKEVCPYLQKAQKMGGKIDSAFFDLICGDKPIKYTLLGNKLKLNIAFTYPSSW
jgi:tetratricopeptide (TPR) repeat protein